MAAEQFDDTWMWHPSFTEERRDTAGLLVHFRRDIVLEGEAPKRAKLHVTADTRYKLYVNSQLASFGPVKGDLSRWFYDEIDIAPYLVPGTNHIRVLVLRFFHATSYAASFPRGPVSSLRIVAASVEEKGVTGQQEALVALQLRSGPAWETAIDPFTVFRIDEPEDDFLHTYERVTRQAGQELEWVAARTHRFQKSTGVVPPWHLSPRMIPRMALETASFTSLQNVQSTLSPADWEAVLVAASGDRDRSGILLPAGSSHRIDIEAPHHMTAFLRFRFRRSSTTGSTLSVRYAESYEDTPVLVPYLRRKGHRCDYAKFLFGPVDIYELEGGAASVGEQQLLRHYYEDEEHREIYAPFHFRTFRFLQLTLDVGPSSDLLFEGIDIQEARYPLRVAASVQAAGPGPVATETEQLWTTSLRTLANCMHDTYEDCPFYEQLQYAMDTRSAALFTYCVSGDDRLARQALLQLRDSFQPALGLTSSRAPAHRPQVIPHFSLFWVAMLADHWAFFGDAAFVAPFGPVVDAVLGYFHARTDANTALVVSSENDGGVWNFVDWAEPWRPYGIPPAAARTGISTYTNHLYAYALTRAMELARVAGRPYLADEYAATAAGVVHALRMHCFDGTFFTDSLARGADAAEDYSVHNQVWAVLSGAAPLYEFTAEVAGVRPAAPGWAAICVEPRLSLFPEFRAAVPMKAVDGLPTGMVHVSWRGVSPGVQSVTLRVELVDSTATVPVYVRLPGQPVHVLDGSTAMDFVVWSSEAVVGQD